MAALFALAGPMCLTGILIQLPDWRTALLLLVGVISFCRLHYLAYYVIEHYIDAECRFAGLWSAAIWLWRRSSQRSDRARARVFATS